MKKYIAASIAVALIIFVFGSEVNAQAVQKVVADIPFSFHVRNQRLPPGRYEFERMSVQTFPSALMVRSAGTSAAGPVIIVNTLPGETNTSVDTCLITFDRYGSAYYLRAVNLPSSSQALKVSKSSSERDRARLVKPDPPVVIRPTVNGN